MKTRWIADGFWPVLGSPSPARWQDQEPVRVTGISAIPRRQQFTNPHLSAATTTDGCLSIADTLLAVTVFSDSSRTAVRW
jgi:hypothetical protein